MNIRLTQTFCLLLILCSCKSLQPVTSRNNANTSTASSRKKNPQFLDDVSITPGEKKSHDYTYKTPANESEKKYYDNVAPSNFNIENADALQIKYSIMMNVPV